MVAAIGDAAAARERMVKDKQPAPLDFGARLFALDATSIDPSLPVPIGVQVRGLLTHLLAHGDLAPGTRLPSVRELAESLGIAVMTANQVYKHLAQNGHIEIRRGLGAFTPSRTQSQTATTVPLALLRSDVDALLAKAARHGVPVADLVAMIGAQSKLRPAPGLHIAVVGPYRSVVPGYVEAMRAILSEGDEVSMFGIGDLASDPAALAACAGADLVIVNANRRKELIALVGATANVIALRLDVSEVTAARLRHLNADARLLIVASEDVYAPTFRPAVRKIAPHLRDVRTTSLQRPNVLEALQDRDVILYSAGAEKVTGLAPQKEAFEYLYTPNPQDMEAVLVPAISVARRARRSGVFAKTREKSSA